MAENSGIEWTNHTFNPWIGCTKISPACDHCYAADWDARYTGGLHWGPKAPRRRTSAKNWNEPRKWDRKAQLLPYTPRVFCASLADVFDNQVPEEWRADLWALIKETPNLDWLLLTKRPQNIRKMLPADWGDGWLNVWLGTTVESQEEAEKRIPHLLDVPAFVRFLSCEPLLGPLNLRKIEPRDGAAAFIDALSGLRYFCPGVAPIGPRIDWVITGGESGPMYRHAEPDWFRGLRDQCAATNVPFLFKQWEGPSQVTIKKMGRELDGVIHDGYPNIENFAKRKVIQHG